MKTGFDEAVKATGITGICGSGIIEVLAEMYLAGIMSMDGVIDGQKAARIGRGSKPMAAPSAIAFPRM